MEETEKIFIYINRELKKALSCYIVLNSLNISENKLDKKKFTENRFATLILKAWANSPSLKVDTLLFKGIKRGQNLNERMNLRIDKDTYMKLSKIYVEHYYHYCESLNFLVVNILDQWAIENVEAYRDFRKNEF